MLLDRLGIDPPIGGSFDDELLSLTQLLEITKNPALLPEATAEAVLRTAAGVHDFAAKVLSVETLPEFDKFKDHLRLIASKKLVGASISQNAAGRYDDDTARKMAELYIGCLAAHIGLDVDLDSPTAAKGDNPDVIVTLRADVPNASDERWAIAVKTISSRNGQTIFERVAEGAGQINHPACPADFGIVVINTKDALDHQKLWATVFADEAQAKQALSEELSFLADQANANRSAADWDAVLSGKAVRPVVFLGQTVVRLPTAASADTPTPLKMMQLFDAGGELNDTAASLVFHMNEHMQRILRGVPGAPGIEPS
jgi:hypothetical protein